MERFLRLNICLILIPMSRDTTNAGLAYLLSIMLVTSVAFAALILKNYIDIAEAKSVMCLVEQKG